MIYLLKTWICPAFNLVPPLSLPVAERTEPHENFLVEYLIRELLFFFPNCTADLLYFCIGPDDRHRLKFFTTTPGDSES